MLRKALVQMAVCEVVGVETAANVAIPKLRHTPVIFPNDTRVVRRSKSAVCRGSFEERRFRDVPRMSVIPPAPEQIVSVFHDA